MIGVAGPVNGATDISTAPAALTNSASQPRVIRRAELSTDQSIPGHCDEPDQHRQVHVHDQRDPEEVAGRHPLSEPRRAREHQQDREQAGADERCHAQAEPTGGERPLLGRRNVQIEALPARRRSEPVERACSQ